MSVARCSIHGVPLMWRFDHLNGVDRQVCPLCEKEDTKQDDDDDEELKQPKEREYVKKECDECDGSGTGRYGIHECKKCYGEGKIKRRKKE